MEIPCPLQSAAVREPGSPAILAHGVEISYGELDRLVSGTAERLASIGAREGQLLALHMERSWRAVVLMLAGIRAGAVVCPLSTRLPPAVVRDRCRELGAAVVVSSEPVAWAASPEELIESRRARAGRLDLNRPATMVFTSGSTGRSRAALHTYGNHYYNAAGSNRNILLGPGHRWLLSLPVYHVGGVAVLFRCILAGAALVIPGATESLARAVRRVTHASMVPTQLRRLLLEESKTPHPTQALLLGGDAIPSNLLDAAVERGLPVHTSYGLTEMASQVAATPADASRADLATAGRVLPYRELRFDDAGQILVRGPTRFAGYAEGTEVSRPFDENGWFATGDLGRLDAEGRLVVLGRIDHMFVSGGENIHPEEIEAALGAVRSVGRVAVVPVEDAEYGRRPVAFVEILDGEIDERCLREAVEKVLPRFMVPEAFYDWPRDHEGRGLKLDRGRLADRAQELRG